MHKDFELPGFPTISTGILLINPTKVTNKFSFKALFMDIFLSLGRLNCLE